MALQIYTFNLDIVEGRQEIDLDPVLNAFQSLCTSVSHPSPAKFRAYQQVAYCCFIKFSSMGPWLSLLGWTYVSATLLPVILQMQADPQGSTHRQHWGWS